jgi:rhamnosyltransferase
MEATNVCAVVVTYQAEQVRLERLLEMLGGTVRHVVVVDNGSPALDKAQLVSSYPRLFLKTLPCNQGIAAAQNEGIRLAARMGVAYVMFLDQDSRPRPDMLARLLSAYERLKSEGQPVACVGPELRLRGSEAPGLFPRPGTGGLRSVRCDEAAPFIECDYLIASGTLLALDVLREVGELEERLFIDHVDTEWCYRARAKGYRIFAVCGAILDHELGTGFHRIWIARWRRIARHRAFRYYYMFRNVLLLSRRPYVPLGWRARQWGWLCLLFVAFGVLSGPRSRELKMMLKGLRHGFHGIAGELMPREGGA